MADFDNFSEINENFDTIKTLLNSIRAQGILNTSDVDKLLTGINSKLEKINTEEDIDLRTNKLTQETYIVVYNDDFLPLKDKLSDFYNENIKLKFD